MDKKPNIIIGDKIEGHEDRMAEAWKRSQKQRRPFWRAQKVISRAHS